MQIKCDKCSAVSDSITPETYLENDIEFTFFRCPACGEVYPAISNLPSSGAQHAARSIRCVQRTQRSGQTLRNTPGCEI